MRIADIRDFLVEFSNLHRVCHEVKLHMNFKLSDFDLKLEIFKFYRYSLSYLKSRSSKFISILTIRIESFFLE